MANNTRYQMKCLTHRGKNSWLEIALILAIFFILGGAPAPHVNETYYLTKAKHYWNPDWCAGDLFLESADAHLTFYWTVGWLTRIFSLPVVAWIARVAAWLLLAVAWQRLSHQIVKGPLRAALSAMLLVTLIDQINFAGEWLVGGVEGKCFAYALVFFGLAEVVRGRWTAAWPWLGLAGAFHVLVGGWSAIVAAGVWICEKRQDRPSLLKMFPSILLAGVFALPGIVPALQLTASVPKKIVDDANQIYVFDRIPHHLAPLTLPATELGRKSAWFLGLLVGFFALWYFVRAAEQTNTTSRLVRLLRFAAGSLVLSVVALLWHLVHWNDPAGAASLLKYYWFRLADIAVPVAVSLTAVWLIDRWVARRSRLVFAAVAAAILLPCWHLLSVSGRRFVDPTPPADQRAGDYSAWRDTCDWVRENTPADALFLTPYSSQSFTWNADRPELVTWKNVPQDARALITWRDRYRDVFWHIDATGERVRYTSLAEQGTKRIRQLAERYEIDYVVTREYPPLQLPVAFTNGYYTVYAIGSR